MRDGVRRTIFAYLIKNIPEGTNKMVGFHGAGEAVIEMLLRDYRGDCDKRFLQSFAEYYTEGTYDEQGRAINPMEKKYATTVEEACEHHNGLLRYPEIARKWGAETMYMKESEEAIDWLIKEGYVREWKKPAAFGYKWYLGVTSKGWSVAHLYK